MIDIGLLQVPPFVICIVVAQLVTQLDDLLSWDLCIDHLFPYMEMYIFPSFREQSYVLIVAARVHTHSLIPVSRSR